MSGGYIDCACRDCFEITIGELGTLCDECQTAGCEPHPLDCEADGCPQHAECEAPHAYGRSCADPDCCSEPDDLDTGDDCPSPADFE